VPNNELDELRQRVRELESKTQQKIKRNARKGVKLQGSKYDPIRPNAPVSNYTKIQLEVYSRKLETFNSRANQFVPGRRGTPLPIQQWRTYKRYERQANKIVQSHLDRVKDVYVPQTGMTVGQRIAATQSEFPQTANPASNSVYQTLNRNSNGIVSEKALNKLIKQQREKVSPARMKKEIRSGRKQFDAMMLMAGRSDISDIASKLTDHQFNFLWRFTNTAGASSLAYEIQMRKLAGNNARWYDQVADDSMGDVQEMVEWVGKNIPTDIDDKPKAKRPRNYTNTNAGAIKIWTDTKAGPIDIS
jgi:hypothetical protein